MCSPKVIDRVIANFNPEGHAPGATRARPVSTIAAPTPARSFSHVLDLTHPLNEGFPSANGEQWLTLEDFLSFNTDGINFKVWHVHEHIGTHIDAPIHFSEDGESAEQIPAAALVVPLVVLDIRARATKNPDAELTPDDVNAWEAKHGTVPQGCCLAVNSGWDRNASGPKYRNVDEAGTMHFPGVHVEAARMLMEDRDVIGLAVDTLSIDHGRSTEFPTHREWLPSGRWAVEGVAHLDSVPPLGATIVVGGPTIVGATGGPSRILALVDGASMPS